MGGGLFAYQENFIDALHRYTAAAAKVLQSCPTLCDPIDGSPPGSSIPGILQARILEWVAIFSCYKHTHTHINMQNSMLVSKVHLRNSEIVSQWKIKLRSILILVL